MVFPLVPSPLGGNLGAKTASFFALDPVLGIVPIEPVLDLVPGFSPFRVTMDMVDSEQATFSYDVTEHAIQDFLDITSNVHKRLESITISGTLGATAPMFPGAAAPSVGSFSRLDLLRVANLKRLADLRRPVMVVTPRVGLAKAFIANISQSWSPSDAESTALAVTLKEARMVSPMFNSEPDYPSMPSGNNAAVGGGMSATRTVGETATASTVAGIAPTVGAA